jgi:hypothetical protein
MTNNCRPECADCEHAETCLLEDYQCSMLEESQKEKFDGFVLEQLSAAGFELTDGFENKCFVAESYGVKISRAEEDCEVAYKVEFVLDPTGCRMFTPEDIMDSLEAGYNVLEEIAAFEGALDC